MNRASECRPIEKEQRDGSPLTRLPHLLWHAVRGE